MSNVVNRRSVDRTDRGTLAQPVAAQPESADALRAASGDHEAFERLYRAHVDRIYSLALRMTGEGPWPNPCPQNMNPPTRGVPHRAITRLSNASIAVMWTGSIRWRCE